MPDMLARLGDHPDPALYHQSAADAGFSIRRADPWERERPRHFVKDNFGPLWAIEADRAFIHSSITCYVAIRGGDIGGFAVYECTRRGFFAPTGVREDLRGLGLGTSLLFPGLGSMREMGYAYAVIGGVRPAEFYEKIVGAFVIPGSEVGIYGSLHESMSKEQG